MFSPCAVGFYCIRYTLRFSRRRFPAPKSAVFYVLRLLRGSILQKVTGSEISPTLVGHTQCRVYNLNLLHPLEILQWHRRKGKSSPFRDILCHLG